MLEELYKLLGKDATLHLLSRFGGLQLYIPKTIPADHELYQTLGEEIAQKLSHQYGGSCLELPMGKQFLREHRQERVLELYHSKLPVQQIAKKLGCSRRYIYLILSKNQISLSKK